MKKKLTFVLFAFFLTNLLIAQASDSTTQFQRKGHYFLESGYNIIGGIGAGSGFSILNIDGGTVTSIGIEAGKFLSKDFAIKGKASMLGAGDATLYSVGIGAKYYIGGKLPFELVPAIINGDYLDFVFTSSLGYASKLAPNILFEPSVTMMGLPDDVLFGFKGTFIMIL